VIWRNCRQGTGSTRLPPSWPPATCGFGNGDRPEKPEGDSAGHVAGNGSRPYSAAITADGPGHSIRPAHSGRRRDRLSRTRAAGARHPRTPDADHGPAELGARHARGPPVSATGVDSPGGTDGETIPPSHGHRRLAEAARGMARAISDGWRGVAGTAAFFMASIWATNRSRVAPVNQLARTRSDTRTP
jgi:hypothetical protein